MDYFRGDMELLSQWEKPRLVPLDDEAWKNELVEHQESMELLPGMGFVIDDIDTDITISAHAYDRTNGGAGYKSVANDEIKVRRQLIEKSV